MRERGFSVLGYIDDSLIMGISFSEYVHATEELQQLLTSLGFYINYKKSSFRTKARNHFLRIYVKFCKNDG